MMTFECWEVVIQYSPFFWSDNYLHGAVCYIRMRIFDLCNPHLCVCANQTCPSPCGLHGIFIAFSLFFACLSCVSCHFLCHCSFDRNAHIHIQTNTLKRTFEDRPRPIVLAHATHRVTVSRWRTSSLEAFITFPSNATVWQKSFAAMLCPPALSSHLKSPCSMCLWLKWSTPISGGLFWMLQCVKPIKYNYSISFLKLSQDIVLLLLCSPVIVWHSCSCDKV